MIGARSDVDPVKGSLHPGILARELEPALGDGVDHFGLRSLEGQGFGGGAHEGEAAGPYGEGLHPGALHLGRPHAAVTDTARWPASGRGGKGRG